MLGYRQVVGLGRSSARAKVVMKNVVCSSEGCQLRRVHWCAPDTTRGKQMVEVPDDWPVNRPAFCSMTCSLEHGYTTLEYVEPGTGCTKCLRLGIDVKHGKNYVCVEGPADSV